MSIFPETPTLLHINIYVSLPTLLLLLAVLTNLICVHESRTCQPLGLSREGELPSQSYFAGDVVLQSLGQVGIPFVSLATRTSLPGVLNITAVFAPA
jgi:hypothetical protein